MKLILAVIVSLLIQNGTAQYSCDDCIIEMQIRNIMTGESVKYCIDNESINVYNCNEDKIRVVTRKKLKEAEVALLSEKTSGLFENIEANDITVSNPAILDGYLWSISLDTGEKKKKLTVRNCNDKQLDHVIEIINEHLKKKKRLIFITGKLYSEQNCF